MNCVDAVRHYRDSSQAMAPSALESVATTVRYRRHQEIYNQDGPVNYRYRLADIIKWEKSQLAERGRVA